MSADRALIKLVTQIICCSFLMTFSMPQSSIILSTKDPMSCRTITRGRQYIEINMHLHFLYRYLASNDDPQILLEISNDVSPLYPFKVRTKS